MEVNRITIGKIKWFSKQKGFGFIKPERGSEDVFVHQSAIEYDKYYSNILRKSDIVKFNIIETEKGLEAKNVKKIESSLGKLAMTF